MVLLLVLVVVVVLLLLVLLLLLLVLVLQCCWCGGGQCCVRGCGAGHLHLEHGEGRPWDAHLATRGVGGRARALYGPAVSAGPGDKGLVLSSVMTITQSPNCTHPRGDSRIH